MQHPRDGFSLCPTCLIDRETPVRETSFFLRPAPSVPALPIYIRGGNKIDTNGPADINGNTQTLAADHTDKGFQFQVPTVALHSLPIAVVIASDGDFEGRRTGFQFSPLAVAVPKSSSFAV